MASKKDGGIEREIEIVDTQARCEIRPQAKEIQLGDWMETIAQFFQGDLSEAGQPGRCRSTRSGYVELSQPHCGQ